MLVLQGLKYLVKEIQNINGCVEVEWEAFFGAPSLL